jgi:hypothetical protein
MLLIRIKEVLTWQIVFLSLRVILWWNALRGHSFYPSVVDLSVKNFVEFCGAKQLFAGQIKHKFLRHVLLEKMIIEFANKLVKPFAIFPFSFTKIREKLRDYYGLKSLIILVYHVSGFTLLVDLISVAILDDINDATAVVCTPAISLYCIDHTKEQAIFVETAPEVDISLSPFYYQGQYHHARRLFAVCYETLYGLAIAVEANVEKLIDSD